MSQPAWNVAHFDDIAKRCRLMAPVIKIGLDAVSSDGIASF